MGKIHDRIADFHAFIGNLMAKNQKEYTREYTLESIILVAIFIC